MAQGTLSMTALARTGKRFGRWFISVTRDVRLPPKTTASSAPATAAGGPRAGAQRPPSKAWTQAFSAMVIAATARLASVTAPSSSLADAPAPWISAV